MAFKPITVSQVSQYVKQIFDAEELLHGICVVGEISGWSYLRGTSYFTLKDENSAISCVCFTADKFNDFKNGDSVMVVGSVKYYTKTGKLNFNAIKIEPYGENVLYQKFLELKKSLEDKGYFLPECKKPIPKQIKRIGVVSSEGGAVIQDIINIRTRRNPAIDIVLYPVKVQGVGAENEIAHGISVLDNYNVDVIVVARGGGSFEDLAPFNTEIVADAVFYCKKPLVSAVGHETDYTIIDFCSDLRAPTPSAAAELLCEDAGFLSERVKNYTKKLAITAKRYCENKAFFLKNAVYNLYNDYKYLYENNAENLNSKCLNLFKLSKSFIENKYLLLTSKTTILNKLNPKEVLKLGYAIIKKGTSFATSATSISAGDDICLGLKDGNIFAKVDKVEVKQWITKMEWKSLKILFQG